MSGWVQVTAGSAPPPEWTPIGNLKGPQGEPGNETNLSYRQADPAATWTIAHGLNGYPVLVLTLDDNPAEPVFTDVTYPDPNTAVVEWPEPVSGWAHAR